MMPAEIVNALLDAKERLLRAIELAREANRGDIVVELQNARLCVEKAMIASGGVNRSVRRCVRCDAALPRDHAGSLCRFFCIDKVLGGRP